MSDEEDAFDVIVIGGGFAGLAAGYRLAQAGRSVLVVERGPYCGSKTFTGGRIYTYALRELLGEAWRQAPLQRRVTREIVSMLTEEDAVSVETMLTSADEESYTVLSTPFVQWLAEQAEEAGAMIVPGVTVDGLVVRDGQVCGVTMGEEQLEASVVIDCEGVNPLVFERAGLVRRLDPHAVAVGAKYVFRMSEAEVNSRFATSSGQGVALLGMGAVTRGVFGGAFLYTNTDSVSLGLVVDTTSWKANGGSLLELADQVVRHPALGRYVEGGELAEYGAHLVYEGGHGTLPQLFGDGWLICGDAAGLCLNRGFTIRGMDYAIMSGIAAAQAADAALTQGDVSAEGLSGYRDRLSEGLLRDFRTLERAHSWMSSNTDMFTRYPQLAVDFMKGLYHVGPEPLSPVRSTVWQTVRSARPLSTARSLLQGMRSL